MKRAIYAGILLVIASAAVSLAQDKKTWTLNTDKSDMGGGGRGGRGMRGGSKMIVSMEENKLIVETFRQNRDGEEVSNTETYILDGKEHEIKSEYGSNQSTASWSKDGSSITIKSTRHMSRGDRDFTMESTSTWTMKDVNLSIKRVSSTPMGDRESTMVYDKTTE